MSNNMGSDKQEEWNNQQVQACKQKELHGRYPDELFAKYVDKDALNLWLTRGEKLPEAEGFMVAIQDQKITLNISF